MLHEWVVINVKKNDSTSLSVVSCFEVSKFAIIILFFDDFRFSWSLANDATRSEQKNRPDRMSASSIDDPSSP